MLPIRIHPRPVSSALANRLWGRLRLGRMGGYHFSRQHPVGRYVADFYCRDAGVIVQLESAQAADRDRDARADRFELDGYRVIRLSEGDLIEDMDLAVRRIGDVLRVSPRNGGAPGARSFPA
jgi:very-short-patch-repair endonuclease